MVEAFRNGFGALAIDPAKGEIGNEIQSVLKPHEYEIINVVKLKPSFDWSECKYSEYSQGLLSDAVLSFFEDSLEDFVQTERYLRVFIIAIKGFKLNEIFTIMENKKYLQERIESMREGIHKQTLIQYSKESGAMRMKIIKPIYNRMDMICGDLFLNDCFESYVSLNMVQIMSQKKAFVFNLSKSE